MGKLLNCLLFVFFNIACEKTIYIEIPVAGGSDFQTNSVSCSIYYSHTFYVDGDPFVEVSGKVKNKGPHKITSVMVFFSTNGGGGGVSGVSPYNLQVNEIGDWHGGPTAGTYVTSKTVQFEYGN